MKGKLITFEGVEGCGKTVQAHLLGQYLKRKGYVVVCTYEPGGTEIGDKIRRLLLDPETKSLVPEAELFLYLAARAQIVSQIIQPALREGKIVICDRYADSSLAYQGYGLELNLELIRRLNECATKGISPHLTFLLDIEPEAGLRRKFAGELQTDRIERRALEFHQKVREGYLELARREPERIKIIDARPDIEAVHQKILEVIEDGFL